MIFKNITQCVLISLLIGGLHAEEPTIQQALSPEMLNTLYADSQHKLNKLQSVVQHYAQLINTGKLKPKDPQAALAWLKNCAEVIGAIKNSSYTVLSEAKIVEFFSDTKQCAQILDHAFASNFKELPEITYESLKTRFVPTDISEPMMIDYSRKVDTAIDALQRKANNAGLGIVNRTYNALCSFNEHYRVGSLIENATLLGIGGGIALYATPRSVLEKVPYLAGAQDTLVDSLGGILALPDKLKATIFESNDSHSRKLALAMQEAVASGEALSDSVSQAVSQADITFHDRLTYIQKMGLLGMGWMSCMTVQHTWAESQKYWPWPMVGKKIHSISRNLHNRLKGTPLNNSGLHIIEDLTLDDPLFFGFDEQKNCFNRMLDSLEDPHKFANAGMKTSKAYLLVGPPGTGKSLSSKGLGGSLNERITANGKKHKATFFDVPFEVLRYHPNPVEFIIDVARYNSPCIIFIDEFHLLNVQIGTNQENRLADFLVKLDELDRNNDPEHQVFLLAATNRPDLIDSALKRYGRFEVIEYHNPTFDQRKNVLTILCKKSAVDTTGIDFDLLAYLTEGCSFSALNKLFEHAAFAAKNRAEGVTFEHLYQALNEIIRKLKPEVALNADEKRVVATYQAAKALAYSSFDIPVQIESVTIQSYTAKVKEQYDWQVKMEKKDVDKQHKSHFGALFFWKKNELVATETLKDKRNMCKIFLAGSVAQNVLYGSISDYKKKDRQRALLKAQEIVLNGLKFSDLSEKQQDVMRDQAFKIVKECEAEMTQFFSQKKEVLKNIVTVLEEKTFIRSDELKSLIK